MNNPASSFLADPKRRRWYAEPWPWFLMGGPLVVVIASAASAWLAVASDDGVVAQDYYKRGLLINQTLRRDAGMARVEPGATVAAQPNGELRVSLRGVKEAPAWLRLTLAQPGMPSRDRVIELRPAGGSEWVGSMPGQTRERTIVTLESNAWRMPVTIAAGGFTEIKLGAPPAGS